MTKYLGILWVCSTMIGCGEQPATPKTTEGHGYLAGQVWTYRTRPGEEASRLVILKVDPHETLGHIIHVRIEGVSFAYAKASDTDAGVIPFLPFTQDAITRSVIDLITSRTNLPDFSDEYEVWKKTRLEKDRPTPAISTPVAEKIGEIEKIHAQ